MIKDVAETAMGAEMAGFLGYDRYQTPASDAGNRRNGYSQKGACPTVAWVQSFADERCGGLGVVYQASNFQFCGSHLTTFWHLDDDWYHVLMLTAHRKQGGRARFLRENLHRATWHQFRQFRYVLFLKQPWRKRLRLPIQPYPKREAA